MQSYIGYFRASYKEAVVYRFRLLFMLMSPLVLMIVQYFLWNSLYDSTAEPLFGIAREQYINYVFVGLAIGYLTANMVDLFIADDIKTGMITSIYSRPVSHMFTWFAKFLGGKIVELVIVFPLIIVLLYLGSDSITTSAVVAFSASTVMAIFLAFLINYLFGLMSFVTTNYWGVMFLKGSLIAIFSGQLIALDAFQHFDSSLLESVVPGRVIDIVGPFIAFVGYLSDVLPFKGIFYIPSGIYSGIISSQYEIYRGLVHQLTWVLVLGISAFVIEKKLKDNLVVLGG